MFVKSHRQLTLVHAAPEEFEAVNFLVGWRSAIQTGGLLPKSCPDIRVLRQHKEHVA